MLFDRPLAAGGTTQVLSSAAYGGLRALRLPALQRRWRDAGLILCYHNVVQPGADPVGDPGIHMPRDRFEKQMRWLSTRYTIGDLAEFVDRLSAGKSLRSIAVITFDDGYSGVFENAI